MDDNSTGADDPVGFIQRKQAGIIEDGCAELQLEMKELSYLAGMSFKTLAAYRNLQNTLSLWAVKRLLRVEGMAPILSRLFAPEGYELRKIEGDFCPDRTAADAADYLAEYASLGRNTPIREHQFQRLAEKHSRLRMCLVDFDGDAGVGRSIASRVAWFFRGSW